MGQPGWIRRDTCSACGECVEACPALALDRMGECVPPGELVELLLRDRHFYETSGGGVTFSGGEPALHADYLEEVLTRLKRQHIHTAIQTCGLFDFEQFSTRLITKIDLIFYDIKLLAPDLHLRYTGKDNRLILENFIRLTGLAREKVVPRVPLVPGITATRENLSGIASYLRGHGYERGELLPYNPGGMKKRRALDQNVPAGLPASLMTIEEERICRGLFFSTLAGESAQPGGP
jgi:pyruvate formate lyase activating enzyme